MKRVHLIAIGGSAMHNMALALHEMGYVVTGSDDEINEPSKSRLAKAGLLPAAIGWFPDRIFPELDAVILGMHAREDNPELQKAKALGLKIYSYPEYIYEAAKDKTRVVIGGSHGKTTITAMVLHVLKSNGIDTDYLVGAQLEGFDTMVKISSVAKYCVIEGDEYLASPIDRRPKFHLYRPNIALLSGIAWDHINVFPTFDIYLDQFRKFIEMIEPGGKLVYCASDKVLEGVCLSAQNKDVSMIPYGTPEHVIDDGITYLMVNGELIPLQVFGEHNLMNLNGARLVCKQVGIEDPAFYAAIRTFRGAARRLELVRRTASFDFYKDFAHSPSKLTATIKAVREQYPSRTLVACMELHTFSSLNETFLAEYSDTMNNCDEAIVYFNPATIAHKKLKPIGVEDMHRFFNRNDLKVFNDSSELQSYLKSRAWNNTVLLMMSSGNFDGMDMKGLVDGLIE